MAVALFQSFLVSDDFTDSFEVYYDQEFCRMSLKWDLPDVFLMIWLGLWNFGRKTTGVKHIYIILYHGSILSAYL